MIAAGQRSLAIPDAAYRASFQLPDLNAFTRGLNIALCRGRLPSSELVVLEREANPYTSTYPSEIATCRWPDGHTTKLICKYGPAQTSTSFGHRGGVSYEAKVYSSILHQLGLSTACYRGSYLDASTNNIWLFLDYLENAVRINRTSESRRTVREAARWVGRFHLTAERQVGAADGWSIIYDSDYYDGWISRTLQLTERNHSNFPWLLKLCQQSRLCVGTLSERPITFIHGEYYATNILTDGGKIMPIDWESGARAAGEIDLATLTDGWPQSDVDDFVMAYRAARWPGLEPPDNFDRRFRVAQLYVQFRWLGDLRWSAKEQPQRLELLSKFGRQLQLI